jgi:hypothetical protein
MQQSSCYYKYCTSTIYYRLITGPWPGNTVRTHATESLQYQYYANYYKYVYVSHIHWPLDWQHCPLTHCVTYWNCAKNNIVVRLTEYWSINTAHLHMLHNCVNNNIVLTVTGHWSGNTARSHIQTTPAEINPSTIWMFWSLVFLSECCGKKGAATDWIHLVIMP